MYVNINVAQCSSIIRAATVRVSIFAVLQLTGGHRIKLPAERVTLYRLSLFQRFPVVYFM